MIIKAAQLWKTPRSFRTKMLLLLFIIIILPLTLGGTYTLLKSLDALKVQTVISEQNALELSHSYVSSQIDGLIQTMNSVQFDEQIPQRLNASLSNGFEPLDYLVINERLEHITRYNDIHLALLSEEQWFLSQAGFRNQYSDETINQWATELDELSPYQTKWFSISDLELGYSSSDYLFVIGRKITSYSGTTTGYLFGGIETSTVHKLLSPENASHTFTIINDSNIILYHQDSSLVGQPFMLELNEDGTDGDYVAVAKELPQSNLRLVRYTPYSEARDGIWQAFTSALFVQMIAFSVLIFVCIYLINRFAKPIHTLTATAKRIEAGELSVRSNVRGSDELGYLGSSFDSMLDQIEDMVYRIQSEQKMKRKAEMDALQAEIKPHFLFNILNTIRIRMIQNGDHSSSRLLLSLSKYMRDLYRTQEQLTLEEELAHTEYYLELMNAMRQYPILLVKDTDDLSLQQQVPRFLLQPLFENACKHGFGTKQGTITVRSSVEKNVLCIIVEDNGVGMNAETQTAYQSIFESKELHPTNSSLDGVGLLNVYKRLLTKYGPLFSITVTSKEARGTLFTLKFPSEGGSC
ncbi:sensor histidine kinase [Alkalicoccobacillus porphyridii]|uniref:HAMP domain-containing protein n=1 Tax=Alkalicoccobacillus porphyridii TaxID=2597270 RepID=A0A554A2G8_9BACI|nr:sensor histidine kinase [Alkalicoccobacillus porphyridii]TSB47887.1 HAMP domain-containing protein [Alkalicoccobacillus porphyridii]